MSRSKISTMIVTLQKLLWIDKQKFGKGIGTGVKAPKNLLGNYYYKVMAVDLGNIA